MPAADEAMAPSFAHTPASALPELDVGGARLKVLIGEAFGATSPVAGMVHALVLLLIMLVAAPLANNVPLAALAAILMFVAWNMGEWREFVQLRQFRVPYRITLLAVFFLTVVFDLTVAVEVGLVAACLMLADVTRPQQAEPSAARGKPPARRGPGWALPPKSCRGGCS